MQHDAKATRDLTLKESGEQFETGLFIEPQGGKVAIENQDLVLRTAHNDIAGLPILGFACQQLVVGIHDRGTRVFRAVSPAQQRLKDRVSGRISVWGRLQPDLAGRL
jgi:hypothetical protein